MAVTIELERVGKQEKAAGDHVKLLGWDGPHVRGKAAMHGGRASAEPFGACVGGCGKLSSY